MRRARWADDTIERFLELCAAGMARDHIADRIGLSVDQVVSLDKWLRVRDRQPYALPARSTLARAALAAFDAEIRKLFEAGATASQIAKRYGVTRSCACGYLHRQGWYAERRMLTNGRPSSAPVASRISLPAVSILAHQVSESEVRLGRALRSALEART